jgi:hypothetical protein
MSTTRAHIAFPKEVRGDLDRLVDRILPVALLLQFVLHKRKDPLKREFEQRTPKYEFWPRRSTSSWKEFMLTTGWACPSGSPNESVDLPAS